MKFTKKLLCLLLALLTALSLTGCAGLLDVYDAADGYDEYELSASAAETPDDTDVSSEAAADSESSPPEESSSETEDSSSETEEASSEAEDLPDESSEPDEAPEPSDAEPAIAEDGSYTSKEDVALYIHTYGHLPDNFITKNEARELGWSGGSLEPYAEGCCIGGDRFGNREGRLPDAAGRSYTECDIDTLGAASRGAKRIVFSNDGLIYYTEDHYETFELLYGEE